MTGPPRLTGEVVSYDDDRGFGFIRAGATDFFVRFNAIEVDGFRTLHPGQRVTFEPVEATTEAGETAMQALRVRPATS